jgi:hypothetical protein
MAFVADPSLMQYVYKAAASAVVGVIMAIVLWPFRKIKKEWAVLKTEQASIHTELVKQRENHLTHIEEYGKRQIELLGEVSKTLTSMALSQAEQTGYCKAQLCNTRRLARAKK